MFLKSDAHLKELVDFLQENFTEYVFKPDTQLNLIEIITRKNAKKGKHENENVLAVGDNGKIRLIFFEHNDDILNIEKQAQTFMLKESQKGGLTVDKGKIMNELQREMDKKYYNTEVLECCGALALKTEGEVIAQFNDWDPDNYIMGCDSKLIERILSTDILLDFYRYGRKELKKPVKKYTIKVLKGKAAEEGCNYLNVNYLKNVISFGTNVTFDDWRASFTKNEIEELKKRDDIAIDWNKAELEEVDDAE